MIEFKFSTNWNNKLCNKYISTIRFKEYNVKEGDTVELLLRKHNSFIPTGLAVLVHYYKNIPFGQLKSFLELDTGYSYAESIKLFTSFNNNIPVTDDTPCFFFIFCRLSKPLFDVYE